MGVKYVKDFEFPSSAGFSGSATDRLTTPVRSYERRKPVRKAEGGKVSDRPSNRNISDALQDLMVPGEAITFERLANRARERQKAEAEKNPGKRVTRRAMGGPVKAAKGGLNKR